MENNELNSCLMWAVNLDTPIDLGAIFDSEDLKDTGIEFDSHITLLYAQSREIERKNLMKDIEVILGEDYGEFIDMCKGDKTWKILDIFDLGSFENDSDYIVLKMKRDFPWCGKLGLVNKGLRLKYGIESNFPDFIPHMTLAELKPGMSEKYLESGSLKLMLDDTYIGFEDIMISYGSSNEVEDRKQYYLTNYKCVDRYFRLQRLRKFSLE